MELYKRYVDVVAMNTKEGKLIPMYIFWDDRGSRTRYQIDRIGEVKQAASVVGGSGLRYRCLIKGRSHNLYFERNRWFIESYLP